MLDQKKECPNCNEVFKLSTHNQRFCSKSCRTADKNKKINERWAKRVPKKTPRAQNDAGNNKCNEFVKPAVGQIERVKAFVQVEKGPCLEVL